ncbi:unnamed protein product [Closterium sp. NIES-65]|nr:unnamed protein product [Closterium sp. NIES-65]
MNHPQTQKAYTFLRVTTEQFCDNDILQLIGGRCDGVIDQLTEEWGERLFAALARAGGRAHNNMAVGYNNIDMDTATKHSINVGNTPVSGPSVLSWQFSWRHQSGVLTETTAELAASLTLAAARRVVEADYFMRAGKYDGWLPTMFISNLLKVQTVGIIGAGRIGSAYARMMVEGFKMNLIYCDLYQSKRQEESVSSTSYPHSPFSLAPRFPHLLPTYSHFLQSQGEPPVTWHPFHRLSHSPLYLSPLLKDAILVNCSRGSVVDEVALVRHLKANPAFRAALGIEEQCNPSGPYVESHPILCANTDPTLLYASRHQEETLMKQYFYTLLNVDEVLMKPGLSTLPNVVVVPQLTPLNPPSHIPSLGPLPLCLPLPLPLIASGRATDESGPLQASQRDGCAAHRLRLAVDARRHGCPRCSQRRLSVLPQGKLQRHHVWHNTNGVPILLEVTFESTQKSPHVWHNTNGVPILLEVTFESTQKSPHVWHNTNGVPILLEVTFESTQKSPHVWHNTNGVPILLEVTFESTQKSPHVWHNTNGEAIGLPHVAQPQRRAALPRPHQPTPQGVPQHRQRHAARRVFAAWRVLFVILFMILQPPPSFLTSTTPLNSPQPPFPLSPFLSSPLPFLLSPSPALSFLPSASPPSPPFPVHFRGLPTITPSKL